MSGDNNHNQKYYRRLANRMILIVVIVSFAPLLLTGGIILERFSAAYHQKVLEHAGELLQKHSQNIDRFLTDRLGNIRVLARSYNLDELGTMAFADQDPSFLNRKLKLLREEYGGVYVDLGLVNEQGIQVSYAGPFNLANANYAEASWFKEAMSSEHYISDVFTGLRGAPHFIVAVKQTYGGQTWILRSTIDFEAFNSLVGNLQIGQTGFAFIVNRQGQFQTMPRREVSLIMEPYKSLLAGELLPGKFSIFEGPDATGRQLVVGMAGLKGGHWILCFQQEAGDAFVDLRRAQIIALAVILVGGLIIILVSFLLSRGMVNRIAEADQQKEVMNEQVIETGRLASIGELASGIAHEINNPVAIMVEEAGWIEDLLADEDITTPENMAELQRALTQIRTQGRRCKEITHKLLSFARKTDPRLLDVDMNELTREIAGLVHQKSRYANVRIETDLGPDLPHVAASPTELQQVLLNLVNNAVDAIGPAGGLVKVTTRVLDGKVIVQVADTGPGIAEANLSRIFDPFFTTKPVGQGTGLGLSICFGIVSKLGGEITVRSQLGLGTVFTVTLPAVQAEENPAQGCPDDSTLEVTGSAGDSNLEEDLS